MRKILSPINNQCNVDWNDNKILFTTHQADKIMILCNFKYEGG